MQDLFDLDLLRRGFAEFAEAAGAALADGWIAVQVSLIVLLYLVALQLGRWLRPPLGRALVRFESRARVAGAVRAAQSVLLPAVYLGLIWMAMAVLRQVTWPSRSYLLGVAASLLTAWIVIRLGTSLIASPALARVLTVVAWSLAALDIMGLLTPLMQGLDALAIEIGQLRISVLGVIKGAVLLAALIWAAGFAARALEQRIGRWGQITPSGRVLLTKLIRILLIGFAVLIALNSVGIDFTAVAVFSGAVGLGVGFGLQKVVSNLISGIILLLDRSVKPGDVIEVGPSFGWINTMGTRYVSVVTRDGKEYLIPNEDLITQRVVNWSFTDNLVRVEVTFGTAYDSDPHQVRRIAVEATRKPRRVLAEPAPVCHLAGFGESSLDFVLRFWIADPQSGVMNVKGEVLLAIWDAFREQGVRIPYPHREVILRDPVRVTSQPNAD
ncbi:mechanosensitive ion channel family protein [Desertibaculum subflavum]|uniref:mechanosensitive ion channel family protein n=1 Tax=Desertibaculum subflavum TaxID=2268458 RepID=UPI000E663B3F